MINVSAVIITLNEEENIQRCLDSLQKIVSEIIIVDSGSDDKTLDICKKNGCKIFHRNFDNFSAQRQFAVNLASNDWILTLDADEMLSDRLQQEIKQIVEQEYISVSGFYLIRKTYYLGRIMKFSHLRNEKIRRFFNKKKGEYDGRKVHESFALHGITQTLKHPIIHHTYKNIDEHIRKLNHYTSIAADDMKHRKEVASKLKIITKFPLNFFNTYFFRLGILDGYQGFMWALFSAFTSMVKYAKTR